MTKLVACGMAPSCWKQVHFRITWHFFNSEKNSSSLHMPRINANSEPIFALRKRSNDIVLWNVTPHYHHCDLVVGIIDNRSVRFTETNQELSSLGSSWVHVGSRRRTQVWKAGYKLRCCCSICLTFLSNCEMWIVNQQFSGIMDYGDYAIIEDGTSIFPPFEFLKELFRLE